MKNNLGIVILFISMAFMWAGCEEPPPPAGDTLRYISGDNQTFYITKQLPDSLKVQLMDQYGAPFMGEQVTFSVLSGGGVLSAASVATDAEGCAVVWWTLGSDLDSTQKVEATANVANGSPIVFSATGIPFTDDPRDGTTYPTITIGNQTWMKENLRYTTSNSWVNPANPNEIYGRLYDWNAAKIACPPGWHLPTDTEWATLQDSIGGSAIGTAMKVNSGWVSSSGNDINSSGFSVYPAGYYASSTFNELGQSSRFWLATDSGATNAFYIRLTDGGVNTTKGNDDINKGFSCRCLQD